MLTAGLRSDARLRQVDNDLKGTDEALLLAAIGDALNALIHGLAGGKGERPESLFVLLGKPSQRAQTQVRAFGSAESFERARARIIRKASQNGEHTDRASVRPNHS